MKAEKLIAFDEKLTAKMFVRLASMASPKVLRRERSDDHQRHFESRKIHTRQQTAGGGGDSDR
jgi:hypothetical protein